MSADMQAHVLISLLAYSLLAIAALQALLAGYQDWQLKHKHQNLLMRTFPPVQTMEALLFELIWAGEILLTLSLLSGFLFYDDLFAQKLVHKVVFSLVAWQGNDPHSALLKPLGQLTHKTAENQPFDPSTPARNCPQRLSLAP